MKPFFFLALLLISSLSQTQSDTYPCLQISGVGCVCGQGYKNMNGVCTLEGSQIRCSAGFVWNGTACVQPGGSSSSSQSCSPGQVFNGISCVSMSSFADGNAAVCKPNELYIAGRCIPPSGNGNCAAGTTWNGSQCVSSRFSRDGQTSSSQTPSPTTTQIVCQSGYYFNCQSCVPYRGSALCLNGCVFNGSTCVNLNSNSRINGFNSFLNGFQGYQSNNQQLPNSQIGNNNQQPIGGSRFNYFNFDDQDTSCPNGYEFDGSTCVPLATNAGLMPQALWNPSSQSNNRNSNQNIVCPNNYCYNGERCVPYHGSNEGGLRGQVNCPSGYDSTSNSFNNQYQRGSNMNNQNTFQQQQQQNFGLPTQGGNNVFVPQPQSQQNNQNPFLTNSPTQSQQYQGLQGRSQNYLGFPSQTNQFQSQQGFQISSSPSTTQACETGKYWNGRQCVSS